MEWRCEYCLTVNLGHGNCESCGAVKPELGITVLDKKIPIEFHGIVPTGILMIKDLLHANAIAKANWQAIAKLTK
jgi:hypothetical protein